MDNYIEMPRRIPGLRKHFMFFDDGNHSARSLFCRHQIRIRVRGVWKSNEEKYRLIVCDVRRKDVPMFTLAMEELKNKMWLIGNSDYEAFCEKMMSDLGKT